MTKNESVPEQAAQQQSIEEWLTERELELGPIPADALERAQRAIDASSMKSA